MKKSGNEIDQPTAGNSQSALLHNGRSETAMSFLNRIKPSFWEYEHAPFEPYKHLFNFRRIWKQSVIIFSIVAIVPLVVTALFSYRVHRSSTESELMRNTIRLVSNTEQSIFFFFKEYRSVLDLVTHGNTFENLSRGDNFDNLLTIAQMEIDGIDGLEIIDSSGLRRAFAGSTPLKKQLLDRRPSYRDVFEHSVHVSEVFSVSGGSYHVNYTVGRMFPDGKRYFLRAIINTEGLNRFIDRLSTDTSEDIFLSNQQGVLQTPSRFFGSPMTKIDLPVSEATYEASLFETRDSAGNQLIVGQALIPQTPFTLMVIQSKEATLQTWYKTPKAFMWILVLSVLFIFAVTIAMATWLVDQMHEADQERVRTLHQVEQTTKMASLGRLASGVAHEINNPLAIINQKAGHIKDILSVSDDFEQHRKLTELADAIVSSVQRSSSVTKRLRDFAGHLNASIETIDLKEIITEVNQILAKESNLRCIAIHIDVADDLPSFKSDRGRLEQIFFNLFNHMISTMKEGGHLDIKAHWLDEETIAVILSDNGPGLPESELKGIFEPFSNFTTNTGSTNLSLAVTYALVQQIGGDVSIDSRLGIGTRFDIRIPAKLPESIAQMSRGGDNL
jgi:two-component system, NtrC family, sensor kinase